jgi:hypothetical protein
MGFAVLFALLLCAACGLEVTPTSDFGPIYRPGAPYKSEVCAPSQQDYIWEAKTLWSVERKPRPKGVNIEACNCADNPRSLFFFFFFFLRVSVCLIAD